MVTGPRVWLLRGSLVVRVRLHEEDPTTGASSVKKQPSQLLHFVEVGLFPTPLHSLSCPLLELDPFAHFCCVQVPARQGMSLEDSVNAWFQEGMAPFSGPVCFFCFVVL